MNKNTRILSIAILLTVGVGAIYMSINTKNNAVIEKIKTTDNIELIAKISPTRTDTTIKVGIYEAYAPEKLALAENGSVILFFHASWCPSCRGLNSNIEANISSIPENINILKTNYDDEVELKKKYGVTYQHTLVQVDQNGNMIKKWSGGSTLNNLLSQIK